MYQDDSDAATLDERPRMVREADSKRAKEAGSPESMTREAICCLLDHLAFGVAFVSPRRKLLHANRLARSRLQQCIGMRVVNGCIEAEVPRDNLALHRAIDAVQLGKRSYIAIGIPGGTVDIAVLPLAGSDEGLSAALVFERSADASSLGIYHFARSCHLTPAEERLLGVLSFGCTVADAATELGCAPNTARTHVRSLLHKTGQPTLRSLVGKIGSLPPVAARLGG